MMLIVAAVGLFLALLPAAARQDDATRAPFPASTALAEGLSPEELAELGRLVQGFVDDGEIVGAELLVIQNGRSVLHEGYGWRDREGEVRMEPGGVFCVRSMTKPVVGAAIRMLVEDDLLELDDTAAEHLPSFDAEGTRGITVQQLLTHTSGLPMSLIMAADLRQLDGVRAVADLGGGHALEFEPGAGFAYSDQGTDTLTALIEVVTGAPAEDFVRERVLEPLGMRESACVLTEDHPLRAHTCSKYGGSRGAWTRFWSPADPPLFPFFLGSQGLYTTLEDYARFLELWMRKGRAGKERLLRPSSVRKTLEPGPHPLVAPTGFPGLRAEYGSLMQLWTRAAGEERELVAFGHTGSDGTHAWAFPEQDAMVLYFTQSRGSITGLRVEEQLGALLLGVPFDPMEAAPPLEDYLGYYWEGEGDLYRAIVRDGDDLALEILGKAVVPLAYAGGDLWKLRPQPSTVIAFDRSETGEVTGYHIGEHQELRFEPSDELPGAEELAARVAEVHGLARLESIGPLRARSRITIEKMGLRGETTAWVAWPDRWRLDEAFGEERERVAFDGETVRAATKDQPPTVLEGPPAELLRADSPFDRFGDWRRHHATLRVIQRRRVGDADYFLVRAGDTSAPAQTFYVDAETGRVARADGMTFIPNVGRIGRRLAFSDFRDVSGLLWPHRTEIEMASPLIGPIVIVSTVEELELGVDLPEDHFELRE